MESSSEEDRFSRLVSWSSRQGASLHSQIEVYNDETTKLSLRMRREGSGQGSDGQPLDFKQSLVSCSLPMSLSYLNAVAGGPLNNIDDLLTGSPSSSFPAQFMKEMKPYVVGRFFLIQQYLLGRESHWFPYIELLPQPEHILSWALPPFWPGEDIDLLEETNVYFSIATIQENVAGEFTAARKILKSLGYPEWRSYTRLLYKWAFCIFTSRSFRPSLVLSEETKLKVVKLLPNGTEVDDFSILLPLFDMANHSPTARVTWDCDSSPIAAVHFRTQEVYHPGQQIFNNYGPKTNSELLLGYGFTLAESADFHNEYYHLRMKEEFEEEGAKPHDFLVSLRPLSNHSSVVGRRRQFRVGSLSPEGYSPFDLFEDALLWKLCLAGPSDAEKQALQLEAAASEEHDLELGRRKKTLSRIFGAVHGDNDIPALTLSSRIKEILLVRLSDGYLRLFEAEREIEASSDTCTANQRLALEYRNQCKRVLRNAVESLDPEAELPE